MEWETKIFSRKFTNFLGEILEKLCYGVTIHLNGKNFCFGDVDFESEQSLKKFSNVYR